MKGSAIEVDDYEFNADESKILFTTKTISIYRRSFSAVYYLYDLKTKTLTSLSEEFAPQSLATYSPDGLKVAFIHKNNLYVQDLTSNKTIQLTKDGATNQIINGGTDWVYEEEFAITKGFDWSPDSKHIAFLKFDESEVKEFTMTYHYDLYPEQYTFKYPKAGEDNSKVTLWMSNVANAKNEQLEIGTYEYIPRLKFANDANNLVVQTLNRHQNELKYHKISMNAGQWTDKVFYEETDEAYVEIDNNSIASSGWKNNS